MESTISMFRGSGLGVSGLGLDRLAAERLRHTPMTGHHLSSA